MLSYFHSLSVLVWFDSPTLRDLVVLDPRWIVDATTSFVRDYSRADHTRNHARMRLLDERARSEQPDAWAALTGGGATLHRALLHILWDQPQFGLHKQMRRRSALPGTVVQSKCKASESVLLLDEYEHMSDLKLGASAPVCSVQAVSVV